MPWHPQILTDQLTLSQPREEDYAYQIILAPLDLQTFQWPLDRLSISRSIESEYIYPLL